MNEVMDKLRILAVEDNPADFRLLTEYLQEDPTGAYELVGACTLKAALERLDTGVFDAVLLDLNLPDCQGLTGLDRIVAAHPLVPIIVLTSHDDTPTSISALSKSAQDYLPKGRLGSDMLVRSIRYAIERNRAREAARQQKLELDQRAHDIERASASLRESRRAALNLMDDAIAARRRAEEVGKALAVSEEQLRMFVEYAPAAIAMLDRELRYVVVSRRWLVDYGLLGQDVIGRRHYEIFPQIPERGREEHRRCLNGETLRADEDCFERADGTRRWLTWEIRPWKTNPSTVGGIIMFTEDITERKRIAEALRESRDQAAWLARFPEENPEPVLRVSVDCSVLYRNPASAANDVWTCEKGTLLAEPLRELVGRAMAEGVAYEQDVDLGGKTYAVAIAPFTTECYANLYGRDITARKAAERTIERAKQEWERTFDSVSDLITILDLNHRIMRTNRSMAQRLGRTPAQCIGLVCFESVHGCTQPHESCPYAQTVADGATHQVELHEERLGGDFLVTTSPLHDADGRLTGVVHVAHDITIRKRAEEVLRQSEERYRTLFSAMTEGFALHEIICDGDGQPCDYRFLDVNPAFEQLTGLKRVDAVGHTVRELIPDTEPIWIERYGHVALSGEPDHFESVHAGLGRCYDVSAFRTAPGRFAVIFNDVTELRAMQQREQEAAIRLAWGQSAIDTINAMREGVSLLQLDGTILSVNPAIERLIGVDAGAVVGRNVESLLSIYLSGADLRAARNGLTVLHRGEVPDLPPLHLTRPDGVTYRVLPGVSLMDAPEGGQQVAVLTLKDVTELYEANDRMEQSERKYRELVEHANSIIMRITADHTITFFNEYAQKFFGYPAGEIVGRNVLGTITPEVDSEGHDLRPMLRAISADPEKYASNLNENMTRDGRRVWVHWANQATRDEAGYVVEILCVGTDVTKRREMEQEARRYQQRLRELTERLAAAEEEDRWRISRYIHDTVIQNLSLSTIRLGAMTQPLTAAGLNAEVDKLCQIRQLLDQATNECRMVMSDLTPALLYELGLIPALRELAEKIQAKHGIHMVVEHDGRERMLSNPMRGLLFEAIRELIMNALKHAGPCSIHVSVGGTKRHLSICVRDDGKGFDPQQMAKSPNHQGGFGLFSVRQRLEGLGGQLEVQSAPGRGTAATIHVPLAGSGGKTQLSVIGNR